MVGRAVGQEVSEEDPGGDVVREGMAAGKGVVVVESMEEVVALEDCMVKGVEAVVVAWVKGVGD